jgi:hypothetical protein
MGGLLNMFGSAGAVLPRVRECFDIGGGVDYRFLFLFINLCSSSNKGAVNMVPSFGKGWRDKLVVTSKTT